eukprot:TRINITY_DN156_c0_g3_i1.p2 TRINITY_DN156_c0_g3~~TRINITY_DN156_c0_g3_i1.p2  ORF type:complete len:441 (-),score=72.05 TRINITY_DN156_c0_g3_i1:339-1661(-)
MLLSKLGSVVILLFFICAHGLRQLRQNGDYSAQNAYEAVQGLITTPSDKNSSEILLDYFQQGAIEQFVEGSGQVLDQGGVVGLIAVRRLAAGIQQATVQQPNIASQIVSTVAASEKKYADAYVQVFEAMFRDQACEAFGELSDTAQTYFQESESEQLGSCIGKQLFSSNANETSVSETSAPQTSTNVSQTTDAPTTEIAVKPDVLTQEAGKLPKESDEPSQEEAVLTQESRNLPKESDEPSQEEAVIETTLQEAPKSPPVEKEPEVENKEIEEATVTSQGGADESMVSIISAVHHSNEAAANMILRYFEQGKLPSVVASFAQAIQNGHTEAALEALADAVEKGLQCSEIQNLLSQVAVDLSSIAVDQLAQHSRTIPQIQNCLGSGLDSCNPQQSASCCASSGPSTDCQLSYAEENSVPSLGISVFRNVAGAQLCLCPTSV